MGNLWHVKNWFKVGRAFSWMMNFRTIGGLLNFFTDGKHFKRIPEKKHEYILNYLRTEYSDLIEKYRAVPETYDQPERHIIWTLWWQGLDEAPDVVKACIRSIERNAGNAEVVVLTKDNVGQYIDIPDYILDKKGESFTFAHLADIIRFMLLEKYGGLWLDATMFAGHEIPETVFQKPFYSLHTHWKDGMFVQHNLFHGFTLAALPHSKMVSFEKELFMRYWKDHDVLIDYYLVDYIMMLGYKEFEDVKAEMDGLDYTSERLYELVDILDKPYDEEHFNGLCAECLFSKLNWHIKYKTEAGGKPTYYAKLLSL